MFRHGVGVSFDEAKHNQHYFFYQQLLARIVAIPGVQSASAGWPMPMTGNGATISFNIQGRPLAPGDEPAESAGVAMPGYFATMGMPLIAGRVFDDRDRLAGRPPSSSARPSPRSTSPATTRSASTSRPASATTFEHPVREVVGVVGDIKRKGLTADADPQYYLSYAQAIVTDPYLVIRTSGDPLSIQRNIASAVHELDKSVPVYQVSTVEDYLSKSAAQPRFRRFSSPVSL